MRNVCLIGCGAVGTIAAYVLEKSGQARVTAILRSNYDAVEEKGFDIDSVDHGKIQGWKPAKVLPSISAAAPLKAEEQYDFVVLAMKVLPDTVPPLVTDLKSLIAENTTLVLLQNGLDIEQPLATAFSQTIILSGVSMIGSRLTSPSSIFHEDPDILKLGPYFHHEESLPRTVQLDAARHFVGLYNLGLADAITRNTGAECILVEDVVGARWRKLLWNGTFNTLCTLLRISVGELLRSPGRVSLFEAAIHEMAAIATAAGYGEYVTEDIIQETIRGTPESSPFRPSMLVDFENGRPFELEIILGVPLRIAVDLGVNTPVLSGVYDMLKVVLWTLEERSRLST
ncbi:2-dehydropantoate 2-reductase [Pseudomassariella vexata]|uniref:2-dehydropantoate 2-reductase n=1 Tax=Pseudomassariella vexata TaxID=1141098 RepID=A0A1Y2DBC2_9PEZI|nr:2-dehydropantoate 2-reductase [Pseudomassariella vexata]ORY56573.1 2-dehydropantoate 2-reductase [Pseudomassariella vexata]